MIYSGESISLTAISHWAWMKACLSLVVEESNLPPSSNEKVTCFKRRSYGVTALNCGRTYAIEHLPEHAAEYETCGRPSTFEALYGKVPQSYLSCFKDYAKGSKAHRIYNREDDNHDSHWFSRFEYYQNNESEVRILVELMIYNGAYLFALDYLFHKDSKFSVSLLSTSGSVQSQNILDVGGEAMAEVITGRELARRAILRVLFAYPDFKHCRNDHIGMAKRVLELCPRVEPCDVVAALFSKSAHIASILQLLLSHLPNEKLQLPPYDLLIPTFDVASQLAMEKATTVDPFWVLGSAAWLEGRHDLEEIVQPFFDKGHEVNEICGPYGTIWHSFIASLLVYPSSPGIGFYGSTVKRLKKAGADPFREGPFGNALEFIWRILHSPGGMLAIRRNDGGDDGFEYIYVIRYGRGLVEDVLDMGVPNRRPDPDGTIASRRAMTSILLYTEEYFWDHMRSYWKPDPKVSQFLRKVLLSNKLDLHEYTLDYDWKSELT